MCIIFGHELPKSVDLKNVWSLPSLAIDLQFLRLLVVNCWSLQSWKIFAQYPCWSWMVKFCNPQESSIYTTLGQELSICAVFKNLWLTSILAADLWLLPILVEILWSLQLSRIFNLCISQESLVFEALMNVWLPTLFVMNFQILQVSRIFDLHQCCFWIVKFCGY